MCEITNDVETTTLIDNENYEYDMEEEGKLEGNDEWHEW